MGIVINIDNYTSNGILKKGLSSSETALLSRTENLINSALKTGKGTTGDSPVRCCDLNTGSSCENTLKIIITDVPNELKWSCAECGSEGVIRNWRKSPVYLKSLRNRIKKEITLNTVLKLSKEKFYLLKNIGSTKGDLFIILNSAVEGDTEYTMHIAEFDILRILELIAEKIRKNPERKDELLGLKKEIMDSFYSSKLL